MKNIVLVANGTIALEMAQQLKAQGEQYLRKAAEKKGSAIDLNDREAVPYLKEAMQGAGYEVSQ